MRLLEPVPMFAIPSTLSDALGDAVKRGREEAAGWVAANPDGSERRFDRDVLASAPPLPDAEATRAELRVVHEAQASRTDAQTTLAQAYDHDTGWATWNAAVEDIRRAAGPDQARLAAQLIDTAAARTDQAVAELKRSHDRPRPYEIDATVTTVVRKPGGNASYPSGHASGAFAAALVLAAFLPERANQLLDVAEGVAYSRVYGGVHFPSDVIVGAQLAARVTADVLRRAGQPRSV